MDRLSALMARFELLVDLSASESNFLVLGDAPDGDASCLCLGMRGDLDNSQTRHVLLRARVDWGGDGNPLFRALPQVVHFNVKDDPDTASLADVLVGESRAARCGSESVLNRLCEVLIV